MTALFHRTTLFALAFTIGGAEVISDLTVGVFDETRALEVKAQQFWEPILSAAQNAKMAEHAQLYADTEKVIAEFPSTAPAEVKQALTEALARLRHADDLVLVQAIQSTQLASDELRKPVARAKQAAFSFMTGGQVMSIFRDRLRRFASEGTYSERLVELVEKRQADVLPVLQGTVQITGDVLTDCRTASAQGFEVLKHDIYHKGPKLRGARKTPDNAKAVANRLIEAAGETRHNFVQFITATVSRVTQDHEGKSDGASATVMRASLDVQMQDSFQIGGSVGGLQDSLRIGASVLLSV